MGRSPKNFTREEAEDLLEGPASVHEVMQVLLRLPPDVDPRLAARTSLGLFERAAISTYFFARGSLDLPEDVISLVIKGLKKHRTHSHALFVVEAMRDSRRRGDWRGALMALLDMQHDNYTWGSKQRRASIAAIAKTPKLLAAVQAAVTGSPHPLVDMLAVLAADGSDASIDALLPHFVRAEKNATSQLEKLKKLVTHAKKTPAMEAMFASVQRRLETRNERSPVLSFARSLGFEGDRFRGRVALRTTNSAYEGQISFDSKKAKWLSVCLRRERGRAGSRLTEFNNEEFSWDELNLGACELAELPAWLARTEKKLKIQWRTEPATLDLRKADAARLTKWLFSAAGKKKSRAA